MTPGIYTISAAEYHADLDGPSLSSSIIKVLCSSSPRHAWTKHPRLNPAYASVHRDIFDLGTIAHDLMLQGLGVAHVVEAKNTKGEPVKDWRTKAAKQERDQARAAGKVPVLPDDLERLQAMVLAGKQQIAAHREISDAFVEGAGKPEQTLKWIDDYGVLCRARLDWLPDPFHRVYDYKATGTSFNPEAISAKFVTSQGWDIQSAWYLRGLKKITGIDADFVFVGQEDYAPHALSAFAPHNESLIYGEKKIQYALELFARCLDRDKWPCYPNHITTLPFDEWDAERWAYKESK